MDLTGKINELTRKYGDPRLGAQARGDLEGMRLLMSCPPVLGVVVDNRDPDCLGRIRMSMDAVTPGAVSPWLPFAGRWRQKEAGFFVLPDLGTQVAACFTKGYRDGAVLGCIYDAKHRPPKASAENPSDSILYQTRHHRLEIIDEDGGEEIRLETARGRMGVVLSRDKGIRIFNELGGIKVRCKKFTVEAGDSIRVSAGKSFSLESDDNILIKAKGKANLQSDREISVRGKNVKMQGSRGVCAGGKQIAVKGDRVMGMDVHIMTVPSGNGTADVPLPHPFIGQMKDKLSDDVKIGGKNIAVKGSVAKHSDSKHMQLPGTIKFSQNPGKEGEVTGGTCPKVKAGGREVAVIGSTVSTCNDVGAQNNSTILAAGMSMPMPMIVNPLNTEEYEREQKEAEKKEPALRNVKWTKTSVREGEEAELTAGVKDIADGNMVTLQVFPEGRGPEDGVAYAKFPLIVDGGSVSAVWKYSAEKKDPPPDSDPRFIFSAHSAWCNFEKSSNTLTVELVRPEIKKAGWKDEDGNSAAKGLVGQKLKLSAETKDLDDGANVAFTVYSKQTGEAVYENSAKVEGGRAECEWTYRYRHDPNNPLRERPEFYFTVDAQRCKQVKSGECEMSARIEIQFADGDDYAVPNTKYTIYCNGEEYESGNLDKGHFEKEDLVPGLYEVLLEKNKDGNEEKPEDKIDILEQCKRSVIYFRELGFTRKELSLEKTNRFVLQLMKMYQTE